jgi:uncharacterized membrane protein YdjX (TVP38/TMEM64 family)
LTRHLASRLWRPALLVAGLAATAAVLHGVPGESLARAADDRDSLEDLLAFAGAGAALCAAGVPRQVVAYGAGFAFGLWGGLALAMVAQLTGCAIDLAWARLIARDWVMRRLGGRLARIDRFLAANPFTATVMLRLLPVGNNVVLNLLAGVSSVPAGRFLAGSAVGYLPQTLVFAVLGSGARLARGAEIGLGVALFAASAALGALLLRRVRADSTLSATGSDARYGGSRPG